MGTSIRAAARAVAGPVLIVAAVMVVLASFFPGGMLSNQHPDVLAYWLPNFCFLGKSLAAGHVSAWNPYAMGGVPFAADPQSGWMYLPAMVLFSAFPCQLAIRLLIVMQPMLAGLGVYWFARSEGLPRPAGAVGGLTLALTLAASRIVLFLPFPSSFAWTAVTLAACSRYFHARTSGKRLLWLMATAAAWGQLAAAYFAHGLVLGTGAVAAYAVARSVADIRAGRVGGLGATAAVLALPVAFVGMNLAFLLPRLAYVGGSSYGQAVASLQQLGGLRPPDWPLKFSTTPGGYAGAAALALSFAGWWSKDRRALMVAFSGFGLASYVVSLKAVGRPLAGALKGVPVLGLYSHYPGRLSLGVLIALPVLVALGVEAWMRPRPVRDRLWMLAPGIAVWFLGPLLLGAGARELALLAVGTVAGGLVVWGVARRPALAVVLPAVVAVELVAGALAGQHPGALGGLGGLGGSSAGGRFGAQSGGWFPPLLAPSLDAASYVRAGPIERTLQAGSSERMLGLDPALTSDRGYLTDQAPSEWGLLVNQRAMLFGIRDVQGYNPVQLARYWRFVRTVGPRTMDYNAAFLPRPSPAALDLLGVGWVVGPAGRPPLPGAQEVTREGRWALYRLAGAPPPASLVGSWTVAAGPQAALERVTSRSFDPATEAVLEGSGVPSAGGPAGAASPGRVRFAWTSAQSARATVEANTAAIMVIRVPWDRNWRVTVDGQPAALLHGDYLDQAVALTPGQHDVVLAYDDPWVGYGMLGSALAVALLLGAAAAGRLKRPG